MTSREIQKKHTFVRKMPDGWRAMLYIDHQGFVIVDKTTKKRALWYCKMLAIALARMIENSSRT